MEKRVIFAFILSLAVLYGFRWLFTPSAPAPEAAATVQPVEPPPATPPTTPEATSTKPANVAAPSSTPSSSSAPATNLRGEKAEEFVVETPLYTASISNVGGTLRSYKLKAYSDAEGKPIELIDSTAGSKLGWPLALVTGDAALDDVLAKANYVARRDGDMLSMEFAENGVHARKLLEFSRDKYEFSFDATVTRDGKAVPHSIVWQGGFGDQSIPADPAKRNAAYQVDASFKTINLRSIKDPQEVTAPRAGVEDQYFLGMFLMPDAVPVKVHKQEFPGSDGKPSTHLYLSAAIPDGKAIRVYVGPKDRQWLSRTDPQLVAVINYGWFEIIARPLEIALLTIHSYIGNFGWSIVLLTLAINLVLFPLRLKQQVSMQKMQKIQPQMRTLQDKYKKLKANDPKRPQVQAEMMDLYKQHGVNPLGGCLPLLLQMPVFFGLLSMLSVSIELRRAPWILWIKDLSQHDPYYVLPILFAISMIVMQKMTPTSVDPAQAKMMMIMPVMFAFLFLWAQSGLALYWLTGNVVGIGQQFFINKYWSPQADAKLRARSKPKEARDK